MKIAVVGPKFSIDLVRENLRKTSALEIVEVPSTPAEAGRLVSEIQNEVDGILFTGWMPYYAAYHYVSPRIPWEYLRRTTESILEVLLNAAYHSQNGLAGITYDLHEPDEKEMQSMLERAGIEAGINLLCYPGDDQLIESSEAYSEKVLAYHLKNLRSRKSTVCLTGMQTIKDSVIAAGYTAYWVKPTPSDIVTSMNSLILRCQNEEASQQNQAFKPVTLAIALENFSGREVAITGEFLRHHVYSVVADRIYNFARRHDGAVEYHEGSTSYIYMQRGTLTERGDASAVKTLCQRLHAVTGTQNVYVGVGIGSSFSLAKSCAERGLHLAEVQRSTCFYIVEYDGKDEMIIGPLSSDAQSPERGAQEWPERVKAISEETGISLYTIQKLNDIAEEYDLEVTTVSELIKLSGMKMSNLNRVLNKLEQYGYVEVTGRKPLSGVGRPQKLIRIRFQED